MLVNNAVICLSLTMRERTISDTVQTKAVKKIENMGIKYHPIM